MGQPLLNNIGEASLFLSLLIGLVGIFSLSAGILQKEDKFIHIGKRCINSIFALLTLTMVLLLYLLITKDYSNAYVSKNVSNDLSTLYSVTALWAGQEGSLLLWAWIMSIYLFIVSMVKTRDKLIPSTKVTILFVLSLYSWFSFINITNDSISAPKLLVKLNIFSSLTYKLNSNRSCFINYIYNN